VIITPDTEFEIAAIIKTCIKLGLTIIPRGGGTGYTGGAIPLNTQTAVINTEKLSFIDSVQYNNNMHSVNVGAGVITKRVSEMATANNLVFAVDPTSQASFDKSGIFKFGIWRNYHCRIFNPPVCCIRCMGGA
jgi:FAD/FMN-containing dehydrogenase